MAVTINTNVTSLVAQRNLNNSQTGLSQAMERLSSGLRVNRAKDDAAGLAIASRMEKDISGLNQGIRNANDGVSVIQSTEGSLETIGGQLQRMRELSVQASNETYQSSDRAALELEFDALRDEIQRTAVKSEFNGVSLADGTNSSLTIQVGAGNTANDRVSINLTNAQVSAGGLNISGASLGTASAANAALDDLDTAINSINAARAQLGADESRLNTAIQGALTMSENLTAARSRIMDVDFAAEASNMAKYNVLTQAGASMLAQANTMPQIALSLLQ